MVDVQVPTGDARFRHIELDRAARIRPADGTQDDRRRRRYATHHEPAIAVRCRAPRQDFVTDAALAEDDLGPLGDNRRALRRCEGVRVQHKAEDGAVRRLVAGAAAERALDTLGRGNGEIETQLAVRGDGEEPLRDGESERVEHGMNEARDVASLCDAVEDEPA